jgi:uncharacterized protein (DUF58 family)
VTSGAATTSETLIPNAASAKAQKRKRIAVAFGPRFFLLIVIGLVWLGAAFHDPRFYWALAAWDVLALVAWSVDLASLPSPNQLTITRRWASSASLSVTTQVEVVLENASRRTVLATVIDNVPPPLRPEAPTLQLKCAPRSDAVGAYDIKPTRRGDIELGAVYVKYQGPMRIAERWALAHVEQKICIFPNLEEARQQSVYLIRSRQIEMEKRHSRIRGAGRDFESLREYREGDEIRDICWTAAARRGKLVTRVYQIERSQTVWLVIDAGRLMRARIEGLTKLDLAVNAALCLAEVALGTGDRVGLLAYGRGVQKRLLPYRGSAHLRQLIQQLAYVHGEAAEGDHLQAVSALLSTQKRRSFVVWLTDFPETAMTPEVIDAASEAALRHLVLFMVIGQPDLAGLAASDPDSIRNMYRTTAAQETLHRREVLLGKLRQRGALALEVTSAAASVMLVNSYLDVKQRNLL